MSMEDPPTESVRVVIDTCVLVSAMRSRRGASFRILQLIAEARVRPCISVPLVLEYEEQALIAADAVGLPADAADAIIDFICRVGDRRQIYFLWRPFLADQDDDMVLELAVESGCGLIVTHNIRDFREAHRLGIRTVTPQQLLAQLEEQQ